MKRTEEERINSKNKFHIKDLQTITPLTNSQKSMFYASASDDYNIILATGSAGTGKTFLGMYLGLRDVLSESRFNKLIIIRSCVPTREIGFLPGTQEEKEAVYEEPYSSSCQLLFKYKDYQKCYNRLKSVGYVEFMSTTFLRGLTFDNAIILVDECQNMTFEELNTIITRVGKNSKIIFCGDINQNDLYKKRNDVSGFSKFSSIISSMSTTYDIVFTQKDIVRSDLVKSYLISKEEFENSYK